MGGRGALLLLLVVWSGAWLGGAGLAAAEAAAAEAAAAEAEAATADAGDRTPDHPLLRGWQVGVQAVSGRRSSYDVFATPELPGAAVEEKGRGAGLVLGRRFGDRFLLGLQLAWTNHDLADTEDRIHDVEALITGTVLFRELRTLQPFLRGGFGAGGLIHEFVERGDNIFSYGTTAVAGGGLQVRLGSRVSLELETVATFTNYLEVRNDSADPRFAADDTWQVRVSSQGWRTGVGIQFWF